MTFTVTISETGKPDYDVRISDTALRAVRYCKINVDAETVHLLAAALITKLEELRTRGGGAPRQASHAITQAEDAAMWGVKAATEEMA